MGLPFDEEVGGGGQPYVVYLQVVEELAIRWASVALGVSVHTLVLLPDRPTARRRSAATCCRRWSAGRCWAPTGCPRRTPARTPPPCGPARR